MSVIKVKEKNITVQNELHESVFQSESQVNIVQTNILRA